MPATPAPNFQVTAATDEPPDTRKALAMKTSTLIRSACIALTFSLIGSVASANEFDIDGDSCVTAADVECVALAAVNFPVQPACMAVPWSQVDLNGSRTINSADVGVISLELFETGPYCWCEPGDDAGPADVNGDCHLNTLDLDCHAEIVLWQMSDPSGPAPACSAITLEEADFNSNGEVNVTDLLRLIDYIE